MRYKFLSATLILAVFFSTTIAQITKESAMKKMKDSLTLEALSSYAQRYPLLRQGFVTFDVVGNSNVKGELNGNDLYEGKMSMTRIRSNFNVPIVRWGKSLISGTVGFQQQRFQTTEVKNFVPGFSTADFNITKSTVRLGANFSRSDSLFNIPIGYGFGISGVTDEASSIKRVNYIATVTVPVKRSQYSSLTVGAVVILDPSAVAPFIPVVSYWHKYKESDLELFIDFPARVALRKQLSKRSWTSVGSELGGNLMFFDIDNTPLPQNSIYSNIEIRSGLTFEYLLTKKLVFGVNGGLYTTTSNRVFDRNDTPDDYYYKSSNSSSPYISFSISFLPFIKSL